jgi:LemA protein
VSVNSLNNPEIVNRYVQYQQRLDKSLSKLNIIIEKYPDLKADEIFLDLHVQLEGTENRIATARHEYIYAVYNFNVTVRSFPSNLTAKLFGYKTKPQYFSNDENNIPKVEIK